MMNCTFENEIRIPCFYCYCCCFFFFFAVVIFIVVVVFVVVVIFVDVVVVVVVVVVVLFLEVGGVHSMPTPSRWRLCRLCKCRPLS